MPVNINNRYVYCSSFDGITNLHTELMGIKKNIFIVSPLRLHSTSSVQILRFTHNFRTIIPSMRHLNLFSASSIILQGAANTNVFRSYLRVRLSPLKSQILRKYINQFKRREMYSSISKCNATRCSCWKHLGVISTVTSSVNGRQFSVIKSTDLD